MRIFSFFVCITLTLLLHGQCPERSFLWNRMQYLKDSSAVPEKEQLDELLGYLGKINSCSYRNDSTHALLLHRIGALYGSQEDFYNAVKYTMQSVELVTREKNNVAINPARVVKTYFNLSLQYESLKLERKRQEAIDSCISKAMLYRTGYNYAADCFKIKTDTYYDNGDYYKCLNFADEAFKFISSCNDEIQDKELYLLNYFTNKINSLTALGKTGEAKKLLLVSIDIAAKQSHFNHFGTLYGLYGSVLRNKGKHNEAIAFYQKSFLFHRKINYNIGCAQALNNMGFINASRLNKNSVAIDYYKKALRYADAEESLNIYANIGNLYVKKEKFDSAFSFFKKAFEQLEPGFSEQNLLQPNKQSFTVKVNEYIAGLVLDKADAYLQQSHFSSNENYLSKAIEVYKVADLYFDKIKNEQSEIQSKLFWKTNNRRLYEHALEACLALGSKEDAFYFFEKSRSVLLGDQVKEQKGLSDDELTKQAQLKKSIATLERNIMDTSVTAVEVDANKQELFTQKQQLEKIKGSSILVNSYFSNAAVPTINQVQQQLLAGNKTLIELFYGDSAVYIMLLSNSNSYFAKIDKKIYDSLTASYITFIADHEMLNKNFTRFAAVSNGLYKLIFGNTTLPATGSIIISPDGKNFPFEALVTNQNFQSPIYLLMNYATSYTYSARYLLGLQNESKGREVSLLGMAPVVFKSGLNLPALNGSDLSLKRISNYFSTEASFSFDSATSNNFSRQFASYSILQLYAHAAENSNGSDPVIYFADKPFYLSDLVAEQQPVTRLVVLSACETAKGKFYGGEGVFSFNRGFAALGIPAAISNLWSADNESSYRLTELFYKFLSRGLSTDIALQQAKIEFINTSAMEEGKLPHFWAGTILTGKAETFRMGGNNVYYRIACISAIIALIVIFGMVAKFYPKKKEAV